MFYQQNCQKTLADTNNVYITQRLAEVAVAESGTECIYRPCNAAKVIFGSHSLTLPKIEVTSIHRLLAVPRRTVGQVHHSPSKNHNHNQIITCIKTGSHN